MSLSARIAVEPSRRVALAQIVVPSLGLLLAATTLATRWPADRVALLIVAVVAVVLTVGLGLRRLRAARAVCRLTISDRPTFDVECAGAAIDGTCRLVATTVVWPGLWMLALRPDGARRVRRLAFDPSALDPETRRSLARFLVWSLRSRGGRPGPPEKSIG